MSGNGWKQAIVTASLAALAAFGGLQIGQAESRVRDEEMSKRLDRMEAKIDWLMQHQQHQLGKSE